MTFESLYSDVYSLLNVDGGGHKIYSNDILKALNDAIRRIRQDYVVNRLGTDFAVTETVTFPVFSGQVLEDTDYPFLTSQTLTNKVMSEVDNPILDDSDMEATKGDLATKDGVIYECTDDLVLVNSYNLTFDPNEVRSYYRANGLTYYVGDVVYDTESGSYFRVNTQFTATVDDVVANIGQLTRLYWKKLRRSYLTTTKVPFYAISYLMAFDSVADMEGITVQDNTLYATKGLQSVIITYIPEWTDITDPAATITIPDFMISSVKEEAIRRLRLKLQKQTPQMEARNEQ
jgi:hypothetical protein